VSCDAEEAFPIVRDTQKRNGIGIAVPVFVPSLAAAVVALPLSRQQAASLAYVSGSLGTLIGADLLNLDKVEDLGAPIASGGPHLYTRHASGCEVLGVGSKKELDGNESRSTVASHRTHDRTWANATGATRKSLDKALVDLTMAQPIHAAFDPFVENPRRIETVAAHLRSSSAIGLSQAASNVPEGPIAVRARAIEPE
jgi:Protein of unknown function (DUF1614)